MNYTKPQVVTLGDAISLVQQLEVKPPLSIFDFYTFKMPFNPAYDLDE